MVEVYRIIKMPKNMGHWETFLNMAKKLKF